MTTPADNDLRTALLVAYRQFEAGKTTEGETRAILNAMTTHLQGEECEAAAQIAFYFEHTRRAQMMLHDLAAKPVVQEQGSNGKDGA